MNKKIKLALIGTNGIPASYGGAETFFENLTREISSYYDVTVYCSTKKQDKKKIGNTYLGAKLKYLNISANGWQSIIYDCICLVQASLTSDVVYSFGFGSAFLIPLLRLFGCKTAFLFNHGGLNEWERESYGKMGRAYIKFDRNIAKNMITHVVDNDLYVKSLQKTFNISRDRIHVIRYGGDQAENVLPNQDLLAKYPFLNDEYFVSVSRAQVDNNLHIVLDAFAKMPDKKLVLVSNFKVSQYGINLYEKYKEGYPNIVLIPGIYDKNELNAVRSNAFAYVHSHSRCGTPPSLCEAMNLGLPIVSYNAEVNHEVTQDHAFFFDTSEDLVDVINNHSKQDYMDISEKSLKLAKNELTWGHIGEQYIRLIDNLIQK